MQASLAIMGFLAGVVVWSVVVSILWLVGAVLLGLVVPFTFVAIIPTNHQLLAPERDLASTEARLLLEKWGRLHAVRSVLGFAASVLFLWLLLMA